MKYIILIGDEKLNLDDIKSVEYYDSISQYDVNENRYCVDCASNEISRSELCY